MRTLVTLAALLAGALTPAAAPASGPDPAPVVVTKHREYGGGIVRVPRTADVARIVFHGHRGDLVMLGGASCRVRLVSDSGRWVPQDESRFWRLPVGGRYVFVHRQCQHHRDTYLWLVTVEVHRLPVGGPPVHLTKRHGFRQAVAVHVPTEGRVQVTPDRFGGPEWPDLVFADGRRTSPGNRWVTAPDVAFGAGQPALSQVGPLASEYGHPLAAGERVLMIVRRSTTLTASRTVERDVTVDGPAVTVTNAGRPYQETQLSFDGAAGQWVHLETDTDLVGRGDRYRYASLMDPDGHVVRRAVDPTYSFWRLPVTGRYRLLVETGADPVSAQVRVRTVRDLGAMPVDGTPLTFGAATPGEWMVASLTPSESAQRRLRVVAADSTAAWTAYAELTVRGACPLDRGPHCSDYNRVEVDAGHQFYSAFYDAAQPWTVLLAMPYGGTGSVTLATPVEVSPRPAPPGAARPAR